MSHGKAYIAALDENGPTMSELNNTPDTNPREEIERLRLENSKLNEELRALRGSVRISY